MFQRGFVQRRVDYRPGLRCQAMRERGRGGYDHEDHLLCLCLKQSMSLQSDLLCWPLACERGRPSSWSNLFWVRIYFTLNGRRWGIRGPDFRYFVCQLQFSSPCPRSSIFYPVTASLIRTSMCPDISMRISLHTHLDPYIFTSSIVICIAACIASCAATGEAVADCRSCGIEII